LEEEAEAEAGAEIETEETEETEAEEMTEAEAEAGEMKEETEEEVKEVETETEKEKNKPVEISPEYSKAKKTTILYKLLKRDCGASLGELTMELNWKIPSIRGVLSNLQRQRQFTLLSLNISKPRVGDDFDDNDDRDNNGNANDNDDAGNNGNNNCAGFKKETRYFIKDADFDLFSVRIFD
jgi:hypothetical protein